MGRTKTCSLCDHRGHHGCVSQFVCVCVRVHACAGSIADCVSKWVFRHRLSPDRLRDVLQTREQQEDTLGAETGGDGGTKKDENADSTTGQSQTNSTSLSLEFM